MVLKYLPRSGDPDINPQHDIPLHHRTFECAHQRSLYSLPGRGIPWKPAQQHCKNQRWKRWGLSASVATNRNELTGWLHIQPNPKGPRVIRSCSPPYQVPEEYLHKEVPGSFKSPCRNWSMPSGIAVQQTWQINGHGHSFEEGSQIWVNFASGQIPGLVVINDIDQATTITLALSIKLESMKFPPS